MVKLLQTMLEDTLDVLWQAVLVLVIFAAAVAVLLPAVLTKLYADWRWMLLYSVALLARWVLSAWWRSR